MILFPHCGGTAVLGAIFSAWKRLPPDPQKRCQGEGVSIRPPLGTPPPPTKGGGLRAPSPWNPPQAVLLNVIGPAPALRSGGRAQRTLPALHSAPGGSFCFRRTTQGCFQRGDVATSPLWSVGGGSGGANRNAPPGLSSGGLGDILWPAKNVPQGLSCHGGRKSSA